MASIKVFNLISLNSQFSQKQESFIKDAVKFHLIFGGGQLQTLDGTPSGNLRLTTNPKKPVLCDPDGPFAPRPTA